MCPILKKRLSASLEDYLEAILELVEEHRVARVRDIAARLEVSMSSVTGQLRKLAVRGLVNYAPYQVVTLTEIGRKRAMDVARRHEVLRRFIRDILGADDETAKRNACRMEHAIESEIINRILDYVEFIERCPMGNAASEKGSLCRSASAETCDPCLKEAQRKVRKWKRDVPEEKSDDPKQ